MALLRSSYFRLPCRGMTRSLQLGGIVVFVAGSGMSYGQTAGRTYVPERTQGCDEATIFGPSGAQGHTYTKCVANNPNANGQTPDNSIEKTYALPVPGGETPVTTGSRAGLPPLGQPLTVERQNDSDYVIVDIPVVNVRQKTDKITGDFVIVVDNSSSICRGGKEGTDCKNGRLALAKSIVNTIKERADTANPPKVGVVSYGGRQINISDDQFFTDFSPQFNKKYTKTACLDNDGDAALRYMLGGTRTEEPWAVTGIGGTGYLNVCEVIRPEDVLSASDRIDAFIDFTGKSPRGATDLTFFFEGIQQSNMLGGSTRAKTAIVITDGLPNAPRNVPLSTCKLAPNLLDTNNGKYYKDEQGNQYCVDRQFKSASNWANKYVEGVQGFELDGGIQEGLKTTKFRDINVYNILYVSSGTAYFDWDYPSGNKLFPDDFLIENSARTGNGKVKFAYLKQVDNTIYHVRADKATAVTDPLAVLGVLENGDAASIQKVDISVGGKTYSAVSSGKFDEPFRLKVYGLPRNGSSNVNVTVHYGDGKTGTTTVPITVQPVNSLGTVASTGVTCSNADMSQTVDGDSPTSSTPKGDGFLPYAKSDGTPCRVFRNNNAEANGIPADQFIGSANSAPAQSPRQKAQRLRVQGGTGNCGVIGFASGASSLFGLLCLLTPLAGIFISRRRK